MPSTSDRWTNKTSKALYNTRQQTLWSLWSKTMTKGRVTQYGHLLRLLEETPVGTATEEQKGP